MRPAVIDSATKQQPTPRIWFDTNNNGDLRDDTPVTGFKTDKGSGFTYFIIDFQAQIDGRDVPRSLLLSMYYREPGVLETFLTNLLGGSMRRHVELKSNCVYRGQFTFKDRQYEISLDDANLDLSFATFYSGNQIIASSPDNPPAANADCILWKPDEKSPREPMPNVPLTQQLCVRDTLFDVSLAPDLSKMTLTPVVEPGAAVKTGMPMESLTLTETKTGRHVSFIEPAEKVGVRPGTYRLFSYSAMRQAESGDWWHMSHVSPPAFKTGGGEPGLTPASVEVPKGRETLLPYGEPYHALFSAGRLASTWFTGSVTNMTFTIVGNGNEEAHLIFVPTPDCLQADKPLPVVRAVKPDGEVAWNGQFRYG
jgi:hypothetical protein